MSLACVCGAWCDGFELDRLGRRGDWEARSEEERELGGGGTGGGEQHPSRLGIEPTRMPLHRQFSSFFIL